MVISRFIVACIVSSAFPLATYAASFPQPRGQSGVNRFLKRSDPVWHSSCNSYQDIKDGWTDALEMAQHTLDVLTSSDPFADNNAVDQDPFQLWWEPARLALFGQNSLTSHDEMLEFYQTIAGGPEVTISCSDPPKPLGPNEFTRCDLQPGMWMYRLRVDQSETDPTGYADEKEQGFADGDNLVVCPIALPGGSAGIKPMSSLSPRAGDPLADYRFSFGYQLHHELSHVAGALYDHDYGMPNCTKLATEAANDASKPHPRDNADSWALFSLAISDLTNPPMSNFDWTGGSNGESARPYVQQ